MENPILSIISIGLCSKEIINTLSPFSHLQSDLRVELIVVTPTNNIHDVAKRVSAVFVSDQGEGVYQAMNLGISASKGDYLWFLNSGDVSLLSSYSLVSLLSFLSRQEQSLKKEKLLFFGFKPLLFSRPWMHSLHNSLTKLFLLFSIMPVSHQNIIFSRSCHRPFSLRYRYSCDFEALVRSIFLSECEVMLASTKPIAKLVAGGISDLNRLSVFQERFAILIRLVHVSYTPIIVIGFLTRTFRELAASKLKVMICWR